MTTRRSTAVTEADLTQSYTVSPIGFVRSPIDKPADDCWGGLLSTIELDPEQFTPGCTLGADFSHVQIVFLFNQVSPETVFKGSRHPCDRKDFPKPEIFAQRAKERPNRIGVTTCKLESADGLRVSVRELGAIDGMPVLNLKPYLTEFGPRGPVRRPAWSSEVMATYFRPAKS